MYSVNWAFGAVVKTEVNTTTGALAVTLFSDKGPRPIRPCRDLQLGPKASLVFPLNQDVALPCLKRACIR